MLKYHNASRLQAIFGRASIAGKRAQRDSEILAGALLRLRFCAAKQMPLGCSIGATKSDPNPGAIQVY